MAAAHPRPKIGEPFNPFKRFQVLVVPEPLARYRGLPPGAKLIYGRLLRYAGKNTECYPRVDTLGEEVGLGERQAQKHLRKLEVQGFIRTEKRYNAKGQTSNSYWFLWHPIFDEWERNQQAN